MNTNKAKKKKQLSPYFYLVQQKAPYIDCLIRFATHHSHNPILTLLPLLFTTAFYLFLSLAFSEAGTLSNYSLS